MTPVALSAAVAVLVGLSVMQRIWDVPEGSTLAVIGAGLALAAVLGVWAYALFRPGDILMTARRADHALRLDERLATAVEDAARPPLNATPELLSLREAQLDDAVRCVGERQLSRDLPLRADVRRCAALAGLVAVLLVIWFVPNFAISQGNDGARAQIAKEQKNIDVLRQAVEAQPNAGKDPNLQKLLQELSTLSQDLQSGDLTKEEAIARLSQAETDLQKALDANAPAQREALDQLAKQLAASANEDARTAGEALKQGDTGAAVGELQRAANDASAMSPEERKALADSLAQARDSVAALDPSLASQLNDAAGALQSGNQEAAKQALENLARQVAGNEDQLATQQQIEQALAQIQQSKNNIAQAGLPTPVAGSSTAVAEGTPLAGTFVPGGTPSLSTAVAANNSPQGPPVTGTPMAVAQGSPIAVASPLGSPTRVVISGELSATGTPILVQGTPGQGTPVLAQGQGASQTQGQGASQNQSQGTGQGQAQAQGQSQRSVQGQSQGQNQTAGGQASGAPAGGWGTGHQEQIYAPPSSLSAGLTPVTVQGQDNPNGEQSSTAINTDANGAGSSLVPYEQIYGQYQQQEGKALDSDYIPQGYKDLVKNYFTNISP